MCKLCSVSAASYIAIIILFSMLQPPAHTKRKMEGVGHLNHHWSAYKEQLRSYGAHLNNFTSFFISIERIKWTWEVTGITCYVVPLEVQVQSIG